MTLIITSNTQLDREQLKYRSSYPSKFVFEGATEADTIWVIDEGKDFATLRRFYSKSGGEITITEDVALNIDTQLSEIVVRNTHIATDVELDIEVSADVIAVNEHFKEIYADVPIKVTASSELVLESAYVNLGADVEVDIDVTAELEVKSPVRLKADSTLDIRMSALVEVQHKGYSSNSLYALDSNTLRPVSEITDIFNPVIEEELNGAYTFSFDTIYSEQTKALLDLAHIFEVQGDYFTVFQVSDSFSDSSSMTVDCEHVSYQLLDERYNMKETDEFEANLYGMLAQMLAHTPFDLGLIEYDNEVIKYYKPSSVSVRQRLIEIADLFNVELVFNKFTIGAVKQRGANRNLKFSLGDNILSVSRNISKDNLDEGDSFAYEVDVVDFAELDEYKQQYAELRLGDLVEVYNPKIDLHILKRVTRLTRNLQEPYKPTFNIGQFVRSFTDYDLEREFKVQDVLDTFKIGNYNVLRNSTDELEMASELIDFHLNPYLLSINGGWATKSLRRNLRGIFVKPTSNFSTENGYTTLVYVCSEKDGFPRQDVYNLYSLAEEQDLSKYFFELLNDDYVPTSVVVAVYEGNPYDIDFNVFEDDSVDVKPRVFAYGIRIENNIQKASEFFDVFTVGYEVDGVIQGMDVLDAVSSERETLVARNYLRYRTHAAYAKMTIDIADKVKGLYIVPKDEFISKDGDEPRYYINLIHSYRDDFYVDEWKMSVVSMPITDKINYQVRKALDTSITAVISTVPLEDLTEVNAEESVISAFGIQFNVDLNQRNFVTRFKVGTTSYLKELKDISDSFRNYYEFGGAMYKAPVVIDIENPKVPQLVDIVMSTKYHTTNVILVRRYYKRDDGEISYWDSWLYEHSQAWKDLKVDLDLNDRRYGIEIFVIATDTSITNLREGRYDNMTLLYVTGIRFIRDAVTDKIPSIISMKAVKRDIGLQYSTSRYNDGDSDYEKYSTKVVPTGMKWRQDKKGVANFYADSVSTLEDYVMSQDFMYPVIARANLGVAIFDVDTGIEVERVALGQGGSTETYFHKSKRINILNKVSGVLELTGERNYEAYVVISGNSNVVDTISYTLDNYNLSASIQNATEL